MNDDYWSQQRYDDASFASFVDKRPKCAKDGCDNKARNADEKYCTRHESRETYERYWPLV